MGPAVKGVWAGGIRERVARKAPRGLSVGALTANTICVGDGLARFFLVAWLLEAGNEALNDVNFEEGGEILDARGGEKDGSKFGNEIAAVLYERIGVVVCGS